MTMEFEDTSKPTSRVLREALDKLTSSHVTLRDLIVLMGEQGLLFLSALLCLPFLFPVSIPGVSTVFGAGICLISLAITANRLPWLPAAIADRAISVEKLKPALEKGMRLMLRTERYVSPRLPTMVSGALVNRINGLAMLFAGLLLMMPLGLIPFSNTLPAIAILMLSVGIAQRDGLIVTGGMAMIGVTLIYFGILAYLAYAAGNAIFL